MYFTNFRSVNKFQLSRVVGLVVSEEVRPVTPSHYCLEYCFHTKKKRQIFAKLAQI